MAKNLIKNPCGEEEFEHWDDIEHGGDGWRVEQLPGDCGAAFPSDGVTKYFATSFERCSKTQMIDLLKEGYTPEMLEAEPNIVVSDWYAARTDAGGSYELTVTLLSEEKYIIREFGSDTITLPADTDGGWNQVTHTFSEYGPAVRFIQFTHSGQDSVYWKGWYGARMTNSSVTIEA